MFTVIYLWRGERQRHTRDFDNERDAYLLARKMRRAKWRAWVEPLDEQAIPS